jgi:hypothetical protein
MYLTGMPDKAISLIAGTFELTKYSFIDDHTKLAHARNFFRRSISKARWVFDLVVLDLLWPLRRNRHSFASETG